jgi:coenzyme F420-0:L-glutamate ligase/coenzyme F420-1:gamma-L-glutamate ligase
MKQLILTPLPGFPLIEPGDDLATLILEVLARAELTLQDNDVIVIGQKVVSKAEGCMRDLRLVTPSEHAQRLARESQKDAREVEVLLGESRKILRVRPGLIIVEHRLGFICANAGLDHSNVGGESGDWVLALPVDPDASARAIRRSLQQASGCDVGILIIDSHGRAWRLGTVGTAIGVAGFPALLDLRGQPDLFDRNLQNTEVGLADELAAAASIMMGQADEGRPVVHVRGLPYPLRDGSLAEILRPEEEDLFR